MRLYRFPEGKLSRILITGLLLGALVLNRDCNFSGTLLKFSYAQFGMLAVMLVGGIAFLCCHRRDWKELLTDWRILFALAAGAVIVLPMFFKRDWQLMYFSIWLAVLFGVFVSLFLSLEEGAKLYLKILCVLSVYSLLCAYGLRFLPDRGLLKLPVVVNSAKTEFYFFGASFVPITFVKFRNFGIFREPGVYQYFLILGLYLNNYQVRWDSEKKLWAVNLLLAVTTVSTFATGGLVELVLLVVVLFFDKGWYRKKAGKLAAGAVILLGGAVTVYSFATKGLLYAGIMDALSKFDPNHESMTDRAGSIMENTKIFLRHPLLGGGIREVLYVVANNTSSSTILYAVLGVLGGTLNAAAWVALTWREDRKLWAWLAVTVILFMSFNTENYITNPYFWLFPVMAVCQRVLPAIGSGKNRA